MATIIEANGLTENDKEEEFRCIIKQEQGIRDNGRATCRTDKEN